MTARELPRELLSGARGLVWALPGGGFAAEVAERPAGLLCGAFDPLHEGHRRLRRAAEETLGTGVGYEISVHNVEKPSLLETQLQTRCRQFDEHLLALTAASTFVAKAALLPQTTFVVGVDTALRVVDERFYGGTPGAMHEALAEIEDFGCRFLVAGRVIGDMFTTLVDVKIPEHFSGLFTGIPATDFRADVSSTALRDRNG